VKKLPLQEAVNNAINECLKEGILVEFLRKNRSQVVGISIFEYDEERELELLKKDQFEYGLERGEERGIRFTLIGLVQDGLLTVHEAAKRAKMSLEEFEKLLE